MFLLIFFMSFYKIIFFFIIMFMSFCKIIGFTKQIYEDKSLSQNHVFTLKNSSFTTFIFLLIILCFFIKIINFLSKIGPLWAHKSPYGPIGAHLFRKSSFVTSILWKMTKETSTCVKQICKRDELPKRTKHKHNNKNTLFYKNL